LKPLTLYVKAGCSTCLKARQLLNTWQVPYTERDIFKHPLDAHELDVLVQKTSLQEIFSRRSPAARRHGLDESTAPAELVLSKILEEPRLLRRPLLLAGDTVVVGWNPERMHEAIHVV
jgi:Spx/MgsR family transcriptional regulator